MKTSTVFYILISAVILNGCNQTIEKNDSYKVNTRIGELEFTRDFENGYPTDETVQKIYNEMDFQRACQAYIWALPFVSIAQWQYSHEKMFGANDGDFVIYTSYKDRLGILTANATTPYVFSFANLKKTGPLVFELQPGLNASGFGTLWQRAIADVGAMGPDQCKGGKYLILPPDSKMEDIEGYYTYKMPSQNVWFGVRALEPDNEKGMKWIHSMKIYPYEDKENPQETKFIKVENREWSQVQPRGLEYWERLADIINNEVVREQDLIMMGMLKHLGIEKGKVFNPDERQKKILIEAALVGEAMAKTNTFEKRFEGAYYRPETHWKHVVLWDWTHRSEHYYQIDELAAYTYEAVGTNKAMNSKEPGFGQAYLGAYKDSKGNWLDGSNNYKLHIPSNVPAEQFWSITLYDVDTRCLIKNEHQIADRSSRMDLITNADGSVDLYFGPTAPVGKEKNWIPTVPEKGWFSYLRLYAPLEPYFEKKWQLPDIEKIN